MQGSRKSFRTHVRHTVCVCVVAAEPCVVLHVHVAVAGGAPVFGVALLLPYMYM